MNNFTGQTNSEASRPSGKVPTSQLSGTKPNRRERHRAETRDRIIRAASRLFSERGVAATTVEEITNEADVGKGTFFNYFSSKEDLLAHVCKLKMGKIREVVSRSIRSREPMDQVMYDLAMVLVEEFSPSPALALNVLAALFSSESARQQMAYNFEEDRLVVAELMAARQQRGELRADYTATELALQFHRALFGTTVLWSLSPSTPLPDCLKQMSDGLWSGIRAQESHRGE